MSLPVTRIDQMSCAKPEMVACCIACAQQTSTAHGRRKKGGAWPEPAARSAAARRAPRKNLLFRGAARRLRSKLMGWGVGRAPFQARETFFENDVFPCKTESFGAENRLFRFGEKSIFALEIDDFGWSWTSRDIP